MSEVKELQEFIDRRLQEKGLSARQACINAGQRVDLINNIRRGRMPLFSSAKALLDALDVDIELKVSPEESARNRKKDILGGNLEHEKLLEIIEDNEKEHVFVPKLPVKAAAGAGAAVEDETPLGYLAFRKEFVRGHGLQANQLSAIEVVGESMQPTFMDGDTILVNQAVRDIKLGKIVVARTDVGDVVVKRIARPLPGVTVLASDNPEFSGIALDKKVDIIGHVVWHGKWLV